MGPTRTRRGRPPVGPAGQKRSEMRQITARLPEPDHRRLRALASALQLPQSEVVARALQALEQTLPPDLRSIARQLAKTGRTRG